MSAKRSTSSTFHTVSEIYTKTHNEHTERPQQCVVDAGDNVPANAPAQVHRKLGYHLPHQFSPLCYPKLG